MNENPYSAQPAPTSDFGSHVPTEPARTSVLAIVAFVVSLVSIVGCCVPGLPAVGALLGVFALITISKSRGAVKGNGFAIAALVIGILLSVVQTVGLIVANQGFGQIGSLSTSVDDLEAGRFAEVRTQFPGVPDAELTDDTLSDFRDRYTADAGAFQSSPDSLFSLIGAYLESGQTLQKMQQPNWPYPNETIPWPATFDNGEGFVLFIADETASASGVVMPLSNLGVIAPSGTVYWLLPPGGSGQTGGGTPALPGDADGGDEPGSDSDDGSEPSTETDDGAGSEGDGG